ncbi:MAG: carbon monoxide dehydrogenase subunit G [Pseudomonadota bacterium]
MEMSGERQIAAPRAAVWDALNDPEILKACIPGCQEMTREGEGFAAVVKQKVGPVSATFKGAVTLSNVVAGESYTIAGEGKGGAAGFAKGGADVTLADNEGGTLLTYEAQAKVGGKIAQLGGRLIDGFAKKMADQFFDKFQETVGGPVPEDMTEETPTEEGGDEEKKGWLGRMIG